MRSIVELILFVVAVYLLTFLMVGKESAASAPPRKCQTIPTEVAAWGLSVQSTPSGLYFCYQQGVPFAAGMTEVVCTPMKDCKP